MSPEYEALRKRPEPPEIYQGPFEINDLIWTFYPRQTGHIFVQHRIRNITVDGIIVKGAAVPFINAFKTREDAEKIVAFRLKIQIWKLVEQLSNLGANHGKESKESQ